MNVTAEVAVALAKDNMLCDNATKSIQLGASSESMENSDTDSEDDYENSVEQEDYPEESVVELMVKFSANLDQIIYDNYTNFIELYPNAITRSRDNRTRKGDAVESKRPAQAAALNALASAAPLVTAGDATAQPNRAAGGIGASRRRSILPGDSIALSSADLERLQRVADEGIRNSQSLNLNSSVCRRALQFLESSTEMHPLRMAKAHRAEDKLHTSIRKLQCAVEDKEKRIETLRTNIADTATLINEHTNEQRAIATKALKSRETKLKADRDKYKQQLSTVSRHDKSTVQMLLNEINAIQRELKDLRKTQEIGTVDDRKIEEYQTNLEGQQKELKRLTKATKKERKALDKLEAKLNCVRKVKKEHWRANGDTDGDRAESIRHEIRELRDQRDQLTDAQCALTQKLKREKRLSDREKRRVLEYDVTKEVIDDAMELKNQLLCGRNVTNPNAAFVDNPDLLSRLNEREMRALLRKCIQKIIDLRESSWQLEVQVIQAEYDRKEWQLRELDLLNRLEQMRLENEQHRLQLSKQHEEMFTHLLRAVANGYAAASPSPESGALVAFAPRRHRFLENGPTRSPQALQPSRHQYRAANNEIQSIRDIADVNGYNEGAYHVDDTTIATTSKYEIVDIHQHNSKEKSSSASRGMVQTSRTNKHSPMAFLSQEPATVGEPRVTITSNKIIINQNTK